MGVIFPYASLLQRAEHDVVPDASGVFSHVAATPERIAVVCATGLELFQLDRLLRDTHLGGIERAAFFGSVPGEAEGTPRDPGRSLVQLPAEVGALCAAREAGARGLFAVNVSACAARTRTAAGQRAVLRKTPRRF